MRFWILTLSLAVLLTMTGISHAEELSIGHQETQDDTGINWLNFHCNRAANTLVCDVFQTLIMHKVDPADRQAEVKKRMGANTVSEFRNEFGKACANVDALDSAMAKAVATGRGMDGRVLNTRQTQDAKLTIDAMVAACRNPSEATVRRFIEANVDQDIRTCRVVNSYSHMNFSWNPSTENWISQEGPGGPCGTISVGTLERDKSSQVNFWLYTEKILRTNPNGKLANGMSCAQFPDRTTRYTWRAADNFAECIHLENAMN